LAILKDFFFLTEMKKALSLFLAILTATQPLLLQAQQVLRYQHPIPRLEVELDDEVAPELYPREDPSVPATLVVEPDALDFGDVPINGYKRLGLMVRNGGGQPVRLYGSDAVGVAYHANTEACPEYLGPGQSCLAEILFSPQKRQQFSGQFNIWAEGQRRVTTTLTGKGVVSPLNVQPSVVDFGTVRRGDTVQRKVTAVYTGLSTFAYTLDSNVNGISVVSDGCAGVLSPGQTCEITLRLNTSGSQFPLGPLNGQLKMNGGSEGWVIPWRTNVVDWVPQLSSSEITFEKMLVGAPGARKAVALLNDGNIPVQFQGFTVAGDHQWGAVHNCGAVLQPTQSCVVEFSYTPKSQGFSIAEVIINLGDAAKNQNLKITAVAQAELPAMAADGVFGFQAGALEGAFWERDNLVLELTNRTTLPSGNLVATYVGAPVATLRNECPARLQPGASCQMFVQPAAVPGCYQHQLRVEGAGPQPIEVPLNFCIPFPMLESSSSSIGFNAGHIGGADTDTRSVVMTNTGYFPLTVEAVSVSGTPGAFTAQHNCQTVQPGANCTVNVSFSAQELDNTGVLTVSYPGGATTVNLSGQGLGQRLRISQSTVDFGTVAPGTHTRTLTLSNVGSLPVALQALQLVGGQPFSVTHNCGSELAIRSSCSATLTLSASQLQAYHDVLQVRSSALEVDIPVTATVSAAFLSTSTNQLDFGADTRVGTSKTLSFLVLNEGASSEPLRVNNLSVSGASTFSASHNCSEVAPGQSCTVNVVFAPTQPVQDVGAITIAPLRGNPVTVALKGVGQEPALSVSLNTPLQEHFTNVALTRVFTVTNTGNMAQQLTTRTVNFGSITSDGCSAVLAPGASCNMTWTFTPTQAEQRELVLHLASSLMSRQLRYPVNFVQASVSTASSLDFGLKALNEAGVMKLTVYNPTHSAMTVNATLPSSPFAMESALTTCSGGTGTSYTLPAKTRCDLGFRFNGTSSAGTFGSTYRMSLPGGVTQQVVLSAQTAARAFVVSSSSSSNSAPTNTTHSRALLPLALGQESVAHTYAPVFLRNQLSNVNTIQVSVEGHPGFTLQSVQTVNSSGAVGSTISLAAGGRQSVQFSNTLTHPHVRVVLGYTGDQEPSVDEATLVWTVDGVETYRLPYSFSGRYEPEVVVSNHPSSGTPVAQHNLGSLPMTSVSTAPLSTVNLFLRSMSTAWGSVRGTLSLEGSEDFGFYLTELRVNGSTGAIVGQANPLSRAAQTVTFQDCRPTNPSTSVCGYQITIGVKPTSTGPKNARLTFVPEAFTGLAPLTVELTAQAVYAPSVQWSASLSTQQPASQSFTTHHPGVLTGEPFTNGLLYPIYLRNTGIGVVQGRVVLEGHPALELASIRAYNTSGQSGSVNFSYAPGTRVREFTIDGNWPLTHSSVEVLWRVHGAAQPGTYSGFLRFIPDANSGLVEPTAVPVSWTLLGLSGSPQYTQSNLSTPLTALNWPTVSLNSFGGLTNATGSTQVAYLAGSGPLFCSQGHFEIQGPKRDLFRIVGFLLQGLYSSAPIINGGLATKTVNSCSSTPPGGMTGFRVDIQYIPTEISSSDTAELVFIPSANAVAAGQSPNPVVLPLTGSAQYDVQAVLSSSAASVVPVTSPVDYGPQNYADPELGGPTFRDETFILHAQGTAGRLTGRISIEGSPAFTLVSLRAISPSGNTGSSFGAGALAVADEDVSNTSSSARRNLEVRIRFRPTSVGQHVAYVTFTPGDSRRQPITWELRGEGRNDTQAEFSGSFDGNTPWGGASVSHSYNLGSGVNSVLSLPNLYIRNTGAYGRLAGTLSITGPDANAWSIQSVASVSRGGNQTGSCSLLNGQTAALCIANSYANALDYQHLLASLRFTPRKIGEHRATLTFTPHGSLGQAPIQIPLQGEGLYDAVGTLSSSRTSTQTAPVTLEGYFNPAGSPFAGGQARDMTFYVNASGTRGVLGGSFSLSGSSRFVLLQAGNMDSNGSTSASCSVIAGNTTSICYGTQEVNHTSVSANKHLYVQIRYAPDDLVDDSAILTYTPHPDTGLPPQSIALTGRGRNDWVNTAYGFSDSANAQGLTTSTTIPEGAQRYFTYYLTRVPSASLGSLAGSLSLQGDSRFALVSVQQVAFNGQVLSNFSVVNNTSSVSLREQSTGASALKVVLSAVGPTSGTVNPATLAFTPSSPFYGASVSFQLNVIGADGVSSATQVLLLGEQLPVVDSSPYNRGVDYSGVTLSSTRRHGQGSLFFMGGGSYAQIADQPQINLADDFTIEGWMAVLNPSTGNNTHVNFLDKGAEVSPVRVVWDNYDLFVQLGNASLSNYQDFIRIPRNWLPYNVWTHLAIVKQGNNVYVYLNGQLRGQKLGLNAIGNNTQPWMLGAARSGTVAFYGYLDDFRITQGVALYPNGVSFTPPGPLAP
jgi:hypothetical protein